MIIKSTDRHTSGGEREGDIRVSAAVLLPLFAEGMDVENPKACISLFAIKMLRNRTKNGKYGKIYARYRLETKTV